MLLLILFALGLFVGVISAFFGVGGGVLVVPAIVSLFPEVPHQMAAGTSLGMISLNALIHVRTYMKSGKKPDLKIVGLIGFFFIVGAACASHFSFALSQKNLRFFFGIVLIGVILRTLLFKIHPGDENNWKLCAERLPKWKIGLVGCFSGTISGLTGLGGGAILVPMFMSVLRLPMSWISVYAQSVMAIGTPAALMSFMLHSRPTEVPFETFTLGYVNFALILPLFAGSFITSKLGVNWNNRIPPKAKKFLFVALFSLIAAKIFYSPLTQS